MNGVLIVPVVGLGDVRKAVVPVVAGFIGPATTTRWVGPLPTNFAWRTKSST